MKDDYALMCDICGRVGNVDDGIEAGSQCADDCPGTVRYVTPLTPAQIATAILDGAERMGTDLLSALDLTDGEFAALQALAESLVTS